MVPTMLPTPVTRIGPFTYLISCLIHSMPHVVAVSFQITTSAFFSKSAASC